MSVVGQDFYMAPFESLDSLFSAEMYNVDNIAVKSAGAHGGKARHF